MGLYPKAPNTLSDLVRQKVWILSPSKYLKAVLSFDLSLFSMIISGCSWLFCLCVIPLHAVSKVSRQNAENIIRLEVFIIPLIIIIYFFIIFHR